MKQIQFAQTYNNEAAHRQVKLLMKQHKQLYIQVNGEAWISSQGVTSIRYQLNAQGWQTDYLTIRQQHDLLPFSPENGVDAAQAAIALVALGASRLGQTRLIDNIEFAL